jgi:hypothetical protein
MIFFLTGLAELATDNDAAQGALVHALAPVVAIGSLLALIGIGLLSVRPAPRGRR